MRGSRRGVLTGGLLTLLAGCTATGRRPNSGTDGDPVPGGGTVYEAGAGNPLGLTAPAGPGSVAPALPAGSRPAMAPKQAGPALAGKALPTNQWWTSALTGPLSQPLWAPPLAARVLPAGLQISSAAPTASANTVITPFAPALTAGGPVASLRVLGYGAFHVVLGAQLGGGGSVEATLVQGSPLLHLRFRDTAPVLTATGAPTVLSGLDGAVLRLAVAGQRWDLVAEQGARWRQQDGRLAVSGGAGRVAVARVPDGADASAWDAAIADAAGNPVVETSARMAHDPASGTVTQTLTARRASGGAGPWALLPHQRAGLVAGQHLAGTYPHALGPLRLVRAESVAVRVPLPGLLPGVPSVPLSGAARAAVLADLGKDLADPPGAGGSYFGLKELGRLATVAEVAHAIGADAQRQAALSRLRPQLVDWLTYQGSGDGRYFGYDRTWGGLVAVPAEFGSSDYNDHHFQYGYLVRAAAVMAQADPGFLRDYGPVVDLVVRDYGGALSTSDAGTGFPPFRVFNAYLGHCAASGFAPFADGNNQESSSEAVAAWEAVVRWGLVRGSAPLATHGLTHYAMEAASARMYWLGEGITRPGGYGHTGVGIVWDAKTDYATFFDPRPESVQGIQLLPLTFGSLYRMDAAAAAARAAQLTREIGGPPRVWGDLFAADLALADPAAARARLSGNLPRETSTSRALVRYWVEVLAALGRPQPAVVADGPYGLAFGNREHPTLVAVNPTGTRRTVTFRSAGRVLSAVPVDPARTAVKR
ncbi:MAG: hypothetical protein V7603_2494 [Micromonosporaceae bacterium]